jgi:hypothetical protein
MTRQTNLRHTYVEYIPAKLELGVLYISRKYRTASHLCCCGCGLKVVTPLNPAQWKLTDYGQTASLFPSIGNWSFPCKAHYWIDHSRIRWASEMSEQKISNVRKRDRLDVERQNANELRRDLLNADRQTVNAARNEQPNVAQQPTAPHTSVVSWLGELLNRWFGGN